MTLSIKQKKDNIKYWLNGTAHDYDIYLSLKKNKKYSGALFFGYLVLEKLLKAIVVEVSEEYAPGIHDLAYLTVLAKLILPKDELLILKQINSFNMSTRYPDEKNDFYKICTAGFANKYYKEIEKMYKKLCQLQKLNK